MTAASREPPAMTDTLPDRLDVNPKSRFHDAAVLARGIGIRFDGKERHDVEEYCVSEGWVRVPAGRARDRRGNPMTFKLRGKVEPYFLVPPPAEDAPSGDTPAA
jgi:hypothetical protein